ncbi:MAG: hypothetical protein OEO82_06795 [Gammaproteobacteria bacterium]|nr:hypothetical protein [Gammaproteobacteria bacterium]
MAHDIACYRCGASLAHLSLPLSRQDECPQCRNYLHVCRMCRHFDSVVPRQCREDDAEEVLDKERLNFCDWYVASESAFDPRQKSEEDRARAALAALFDGSSEGDAVPDSELSEAEKLFR